MLDAGSMTSAMVTNIATISSGIVANRATASGIANRYIIGMNLEEWLAEALEHAGISQAELARRLTIMLRRSIRKTAVNRMLKGPPPEGQFIGGDELLAIEEITNYPAPTALQDFPRQERREWMLLLRSMSPITRQRYFRFITDNNSE